MSVDVFALVAALVAAAATAGLWSAVLPRLAEPATAETKVPYRRLATPRIGALVAGYAAAGAWLTWAWVPAELRPPWLVLSTIGVVLAAIDGFTTWIPASLARGGWVAIGIAGAVMPLLGADWTDVLRLVIGAVGAGVLYGGLWLVTRAGFGFGDVRFVPLVAAPAAAAGWSTLMITLLLGSFLTLGHTLWHRVTRGADYTPWAPSLTVSAFLAALLTR